MCTCISTCTSTQFYTSIFAHLHTGTGGTLAGCAQYFRSISDDIKIALTDPCGAALYSYYTNGELQSNGSSITEGIGQGRITGRQVYRLAYAHIWID